MKALFRVDATPALGAGHVTRCMALAGALRARGADVGFLVASDLAARMAGDREFPYQRLPSDGSGDADEASRIAARERADWVVVDHYSLGAEWERTVRRNGHRIAVIEDLPGRPHDCDLLIDTGFRADASAASQPRALLGPRYAMLAPEFGQARERGPERDGAVRRILVSYGGTDPTNETCKALEALAAIGADRPDIEVAVGAAFPHDAALQAALRGLPRARLHRGLPHLAELMLSCDLALGAGGNTIWERLCLGLPAIVTATAANQVRSTAALAADGYFLYLGPAEQVTSEAMKQGLLARMAEPDTLRRESARGRALVDGAGAGRVADAMLGA